jgi:hypothetical protein
VTVTKAQFVWAIREQESGGNYRAGNPSGAMGAYQILRSNLAEWSKAALGHTVTADQFLNSPDIQDQIADYKLGSYYDKYGPERAAAAWYSGNPDLVDSTAPQRGGPPIATYVEEVMSKARSAPAGVTLPLSGGPHVPVGGGGLTDSSGGGGLFSIPKDIIAFFSKATDDLAATGKFFWAFTQPATWIRIGAGWLGTLFLIAGVVALGIAAMEGSAP